MGLLSGGLWLGTACQDERGVPPNADAPSTPVSAARLLPFDACYDPPGHGALIRDTVRAINAERARQKLPLLKQDDTLNRIAEFYACRLVDGDFFSHVDPFGRSTVDTRADDFGYAFIKVGENLAAGQRTVEQAVADWMSSPDHRGNILDPAYTELGIAIKEGGRFGPYWVLEFGRPVSAGLESTSAPAGDAAARPLRAGTTPSSAPASGG